MNNELRSAKLIGCAILAGSGVIALAVRGSSDDFDLSLTIGWAALVLGAVGLAW